MSIHSPKYLEGLEGAGNSAGRAAGHRGGAHGGERATTARKEGGGWAARESSGGGRSCRGCIGEMEINIRVGEPVVGQENREKEPTADRRAKRGSHQGKHSRIVGGRLISSDCIATSRRPTAEDLSPSEGATDADRACCLPHPDIFPGPTPIPLPEAPPFRPAVLYRQRDRGELR
ncbi:hypothetical protein PVAP13_4KG079366 [Panicum virgatum]|uniref:Uncharacterized protein n=1 Tax=Panicum virgatum TaxID=38727 RepID=A0A8T0TMC6_PANVG|nr:hypothetical protein PVAP13_4KG079366 [Panicum virgatum]